MRPFILAVLFVAPLLRAQNPATTTVTIDIENYVEYLEDVADPAKYASTNTLTPATPLRNFISIAGIADIVAINGQPAKGTASWRGWILGFSPNPTIDFAISDTARTSIRYWTLDVLKTDGTQVGTIQAEGLLAVCVQHEMDHLMGKVFVEYLSMFKQGRIKTKMLKAQKELQR